MAAWWSFVIEITTVPFFFCLVITNGTVHRAVPILLHKDEGSSVKRV
jgi:hypothetical protein